MKKIIILLTSVLLFFPIVNAEEKKTLADVVGADCIGEHKISHGACVCGIKKKSVTATTSISIVAPVARTPPR